MRAEIIQAQREIIQGYYNRIFFQKPDIETIMQWLESDLQTIRMDNIVLDAETIIKQKNDLPENKQGPSPIRMKFKDAPRGARFHFIDNNLPKDIYVKIHDHGDGLVVKWNGNIQGHQSHCCWLDEENGYDFDTEIELI